MDELKKLEFEKIPVHAFYVAQNARINFEEITNITNGSCKLLDIFSKNGSVDLVDLINIEVLKNIGGEDLVESYKKIYYLK
jgi:hypothetical protein